MAEGSDNWKLTFCSQKTRPGGVSPGCGGKDCGCGGWRLADRWPGVGAWANAVAAASKDQAERCDGTTNHSGAPADDSRHEASTANTLLVPRADVAPIWLPAGSIVSPRRVYAG